jgi:diphthine-ammonia ligase
VKVRSVVVALYTNDSEEVTRRISEALESAGILTEASACASWLDLSIHDIDKTLEVGRCSGVVPCRSLWDASGRRLAAVLVFESQNGD